MLKYKYDIIFIMNIISKKIEKDHIDIINLWYKTVNKKLILFIHFNINKLEGVICDNSGYFVKTVDNFLGIIDSVTHVVCYDYDHTRAQLNKYNMDDVIDIFNSKNIISLVDYFTKYIEYISIETLYEFCFTKDIGDDLCDSIADCFFYLRNKYKLFDDTQDNQLINLEDDLLDILSDDLENIVVVPAMIEQSIDLEDSKLDDHLIEHLDEHLDEHVEVPLDEHLEVSLDEHLDVSLGVHFDEHLSEDIIDIPPIIQSTVQIEIPTNAEIGSYYFGEKKINPNDEQQKIINEHPDKNILIVACAGSGKTTTILCRIKYLVDSGVPEASIILTTFTRDATNDMRNKLNLLFGRKTLIEIGTMDSIAKRMFIGMPKIQLVKINYMLESMQLNLKNS